MSRTFSTAAGFAAIIATFVMGGLTHSAADPNGNSPSDPSRLATLDAEDLDAMARALTADVASSTPGNTTTVPLAADGMSPVRLTDDVRAESAFALSELDPTRHVRLYVASAAVNNDGAAPGCADAASSWVLCSERQTSDGVETTETYVSIAAPQAGPGKYAAVDPASVTQSKAEDLRVECVVSLFLPAGGMVSARETVFGVDDTRDLTAAFVEGDSLVRLVHDRTLLASLEGTS